MRSRPVRLSQLPRRGQVDRVPQGDDQDRLSLRGRRRDEAVDALVEDQTGEHQQRGAVCLCRKDLGAAQPKGQIAARGPAQPTIKASATESRFASAPRADNLVSHHVRALRAAGLAQYRRDGTMALYSLTRRGLTLLEAAAEPALPA